MLLLSLLAGAVCVPPMVLSRLAARRPVESRGEGASQPAFGPEPLARAASSRRLGRPVYRFSVIPGGAYNPEELRQALDADAVAARHYAVFQRASLRTEPSGFAQPVYVSYRMGDAVYWTRRPVALSPRETLLTDGVNYARARCGNRVSLTPQGPVQAASPPVELLERAEAPAPQPAAANWGEPLLVAEVFPSFIEDPRWQIAVQAPDGVEGSGSGSQGGVRVKDIWSEGPVDTLLPAWISPIPPVPAYCWIAQSPPNAPAGARAGCSPVEVAVFRRGGLGLDSGSGEPPAGPPDAPPDAPPDTPIPEPGSLVLGLIATAVALAVRRFGAGFRRAL